LNTFESFTGTLTIGGAGIGLIALLAAGIGIMNIMLVTVTERTREIGIRKSVGATRSAILRQFLLEAIVLCQIGGLLGILAGAAVGNFVAFYFDIRATFPWNWAIAGVLGVTVIAVIFGVYPAYKAARLDPIEALRFE
jgi:putative ABC transport system permease protein